MVNIEGGWHNPQTSEEKETLVDALLDEPCMLDAVKDPTIKSEAGHYLSHIRVSLEYHSYLISTLRRVVQHRMRDHEQRETALEKLE